VDIDGDRRGEQRILRTVRNRSRVLLNPLGIVDRSRVVEEDLEPVAMVQDSDAGVGALELARIRDTFLGAPSATLGPAVEDDGVLTGADADVEENVLPRAEEVEYGGSAFGVENAGADGGDGFRLEVVLELDLVVDEEVVEHDVELPVGWLAIQESEREAEYLLGLGL
jgi:hypothetical protein